VKCTLSVLFDNKKLVTNVSAAFIFCFVT